MLFGIVAVTPSTIYFTTSVYTYSSNTAVSGGTLVYDCTESDAVGNFTIGVFGAGSDTYTSIYTYATNTSVAGGNLTYGAYGLAATGNSTIGVFGGGDEFGGYVSTTSVYTYASNTAVAGGNLTYSDEFLAAAGNSTIGVFGGGVSNVPPNYVRNLFSTTSIYTYATNTAVAGGDLSYPTEELAAVGNLISAVFGGGSSYGNTSFTSVYTYSTNTSVAGGNLTYTAYGLAACGPNPGVNYS